jgi:UDP-4-amino-4-deoxy-L-arabinose formyltransferase/UDP-glucuronic acid dehydrogenase (UDP-4-keto-hexauronic acid decarboxylating)
VPPLKIAVAAEESAGVQLLRRLASSEHEVACVFTSRSDHAAWGATADVFARERGFEVFDAARVNDPACAEALRERKVDLLLNVHSLYIIHEALLRAPRIGAFNLHPGPLPRYAGLNAPSWAIYHGESEYGVTLHWMEPGIDTGSLAYQALFPIGEEETGLSLSARCIREGLPLLDQLVAQAADDAAGIPRIEQDLSQRSYFLRRKVPHRGRIDWTWPAAKVVRLVRAAYFHPFPSPWGHPRTSRTGERLGVVKASLTGVACSEEPGRVAASDTRKSVRVACADEWIDVTLVSVEGSVRAADDVLEPGDLLRRE